MREQSISTPRKLSRVHIVDSFRVLSSKTRKEGTYETKKKKVITGSFKETRTKKERREKDRVGVDREVDERKRE